jgi:ATP-binding cassette, subfamily B, bacterial PglK
MLSRLKKLFFLIGKTGRIKFFVLLALLIINSLLETLGVGALPIFIVIISKPDIIMQHRWAAPIVELFHINTSQGLMSWGFVFLAGLFVMKNAFLSLVIYIKARMISNEQIRLGNRLFKVYMKARYSFFLNRNSVDLLDNVSNKTKIIILNVIMPLLQIIMDGLVLMMIVILLLKVEPVICLFTFTVLGTFSLLLIRITNNKNRSYGKEGQQHRQKMNKIVLEGVSGIKDVKVLGREKSFLERYNFSAVRTGISLRYNQIINQLQKPFMETIAVIGMLFIPLMMMLMGRKADSIIPVLTLFGAAIVRLLPILKTIVSSYTDIRYNVFAIDPVFNDLKFLEMDVSYKNEKVTDILPYPFSERIVFKNVSYQYPKGCAEAISDINISISKGSVIGLVGPSGAGKTTIVDILLGLLEPQQGRILVDGKDINEDVRRWQMNVSYIPQFIYLSDDTIRRNIAFGLPDDEIMESQIEKALVTAQLGPLIQELPGGLDTFVGERGIRLSGGQRQRIGIARALYNNPQLLIMDEATSALDNITERFVIESIESLRHDRTIVMIAHRLTTVRNCEVIYLINKGRILEQGSYDYLLENSRTFKKMNLVE